MCEKCPELNEAIERYKRVVLTIGDPQTVEVAKKLLLQALERKIELHPAEPAE
jgi:hypothetical protein